MDDQSPVNLHNTVESAYDALVSNGQIESDPSQRELIALLDNILDRLATKRLSRKSSALGWLFGKQEKAAEPLKGLYIWGGVGRGKSMLMDMFFEALPHKRKRRAHFNDFMQDAQQKIHNHREAFKAGKVKEEDPIPVIGKEMASDVSVLCFDEFTVTDIADAMILGRLFETMFNEGVTIIATSNVEPKNLYRDGLNRKVFLPFIDLLLENSDVFELGSRTDYRLEKLNRAPVYLTPVIEKNLKTFDQTWLELSGTSTGEPEKLDLRGREFVISRTGNNTARLTFNELCKEARSAEDYLALARRFHTVFIENVPIMDREDQNAAKRFILLIDTLYDNHIRVVILAEAKPESLYIAKTGTESFEFARTASRLTEMQSVEYLAGKSE